MCTKVTASEAAHRAAATAMAEAAAAVGKVVASSSRLPSPQPLDDAARAASTADGDYGGVIPVFCCSGRHCGGPAGLTAAVAPAATAVEVDRLQRPQ